MNEPEPERRVERRSQALRWASWGALILVLVFAAGIRWRLLDVPLERDEGEYAYGAQLILQGIPPYKNVYSMKLPGIYAAYTGVLALFGQTHNGIHLGLLFVNAATAILIFLLTRRLFDEIAGLVAAAGFALLSIGPGVQGVFANAEHFVVLPAVAGLLLVLRGVETDRLPSIGIGGALLGLALLVKQHGAGFAACGGLYLLLAESRRAPLDWRRVAVRCALFALAVVAPYVLTCLIFWGLGLFDRFWFWTVTYARSYTALMPLDEGLARLWRAGSSVVSTAPLLWGAAGVGLSAVVWDRGVRARGAFVLLFGVCSFLAVCPGFYFRPHYFVLALPAAAVLFACGARSAANLLARTRLSGLRNPAALGLAGILLVATIVQQREFLFRMTPLEVARSVYPGNPFPESIAIARLIESRATREGPIAVIASEPEIFFYTGRQSATGYIYGYPLMEAHPFALQMQEEMIQEIESTEPEFVVFVNIRLAWLPTPGSHLRILQWFEEYRKRLSLLAVAEIGEGDVRLYEGGDLSERPRRPPSIELYRQPSDG
jgi:hypothetical protein